jgi:hydrogenase maturation protein HypF
MAIAYLRAADEPIEGSALARRLDRVGVRAVETMLERGFNAPVTSSVGRLFDAVAALIGACDRMSYEGQAAMRLEALAAEAPAAGAYPFGLLADSDPLVVDPRPLIRAVAADSRQRVPAPTIARRFHSTLVDVVEAVCRRVRDAFGVDTVVLSGGVFLNGILAREVPQRLAGAGFLAHRHRMMPPNDGGLCLGQLAIAAARDAADGVG